MRLHHRILIGMGIGIIAGFTLHYALDPGSDLFKNTIWWLDLLGKDLFIGALKMIISPLIFASIIAGISSLPAASDLGSIGLKTLGYYICTTTLAVAIGIAMVLIIQPGEKDASQRVRAQRMEKMTEYRVVFQDRTGLDSLQDENRPAFRAFVAEMEGTALAQSDFGTNWSRMKQTEEQGVGDMFRTQILRPVLSNPFNALAQDPPNALGIIFFAILVGLAIITLGDSARPMAIFFQNANAVILKITLWIMEGAPVAIGCLIASLLATLGFDAVQSLAWYCATVILGIGAHVCVLLAIVAVVGRMSPRTFISGISEAWLIAFTTTSSAATLPITMHNVTKKLKVDEKIAEFSLPVGATVNMDGTALYEGVAVIFLLQMFGGLEDVPVLMTAGKTFVIFITAVLASVGAAAVPSAGLITMAIVASAVGLPLHYIFIIYAVDHFLDMFRTSTNVLGDAAGAVVVNRLEARRLQRIPAEVDDN
jgi:Na+/H+-dicarboxylate symporter